VDRLAYAAAGVAPVVRGMNSTVSIMNSFADLSSTLRGSCTPGDTPTVWQIVECPSRPVSHAACLALETMMRAQNKPVDFDCSSLDYVDVRTRIQYVCGTTTGAPAITVSGRPDHFFWHYPGGEGAGAELATTGNITVVLAHQCFCSDSDDLPTCSYYALNLQQEEDAKQNIETMRALSYVFAAAMVLTIGSVEFYFYHHARLVTELNDGRGYRARVVTVAVHILWWSVGMTQPVNLFQARRRWKLIIPSLIAWFMYVWPMVVGLVVFFFFRVFRAYPACPGIRSRSQPWIPGI
jgi:hypothetical protein